VSLRKAHGRGAPALLRSEVRPLDELGALNASDTGQALADRRVRGRPFVRGNRAAAGRKPALATSAGMPLDATDPAYRKALAYARRYRARRVRELAIQHGGDLSAGVCAMLTSASLALAASRFLATKAAESGDPDLMARSTRLSLDARQLELTALDVADRERDARPKAPFDPLAQWRRPEDAKPPRPNHDRDPTPPRD
jgi:hypothetical protein